jgi:hypothetical protein
MVLALGTSRPDSTIIVLTRMSSSPVTKRCITSSSGVERHLPCATPTRARGASAGPGGDRLDRLDPVVHEEHLAAAIELAGHRLLEQAVVPRLHEGEDRRPVAGGVSMRVRSRSPASDRCRVRGIGVAVSVSTSTARRSALSRSLCFTPKRCSSSTTRSPRSLK